MRNTKIILLTLSILTVTFLTVPAHASGSEWGPWDRDRIYVTESAAAARQQPQRSLVSRIAASPAMLMISFFQTVLSPIDGASCDFYPTCSAYAKQAIQKHGLFIGLAMASERLCRIHAPEGYEPVEKFGSYYYYDPVENNDFWFDKGKSGLP